MKRFTVSIVLRTWSCSTHSRVLGALVPKHFAQFLSCKASRCSWWNLCRRPWASSPSSSLYGHTCYKVYHPEDLGVKSSLLTHQPASRHTTILPRHQKNRLRFFVCVCVWLVVMASAISVELLRIDPSRLYACLCGCSNSADLISPLSFHSVACLRAFLGLYNWVVHGTTVPRWRWNVLSACTQNVVLSRASRSHKDSSARSLSANRDGLCTMKQCSSAFLQFLFLVVVIVYMCIKKKTVIK